MPEQASFARWFRSCGQEIVVRNRTFRGNLSNIRIVRIHENCMICLAGNQPEKRISN